MSCRVWSVLIQIWLLGHVARCQLSLNVRQPFLSMKRVAHDTRLGAEMLFKSISDDIEMNVGYQLRKIGLETQLKRIGIQTKVGTGNMTSKCYGPLGCLAISENWYGLTRPVNLLPQPRDAINTRFVLRTRASLNKPMLINASLPETIQDSTFNGSKPTILIVHGFIDTGFVPWIKEMANKLLLHRDVNVIAVDWGGGSASLYSQSAANTRLVALEIAYLLLHLAETEESKIEDFHIIGHSLGAHIAGYVGEEIVKKTGRKIGRISGLDPAEPLFESMPAFVRLDPEDAGFVDVIHTDAKGILMFGYGLIEPVGHVDFYPNGGAGQPGCSVLDVRVSFDSMVDTDTTVDTVGRHMVACSHNRAVEIYIESLDYLIDEEGKSCPMVGFECSSHEQFSLGQCFDCGEDGSHCAKVGFSSIEYKNTTANRQQSNLKFYFNTGTKKPFCQYHYMLTVHLANPKAAETWVQGNLKVNLHGSKSEILQHDLTPDGPLDLKIGGGSKVRVRFWLESPHRLGNLNALDLSFQGSSSSYCEQDSNWWWWVKRMCDFGAIQVTRVRLLQQRESAVTEDKITVCGDHRDVGYSVIKSGHWKMFYKPC